MQKNQIHSQSQSSPKKVFFISRLEYEKWVDMLLEIIKISEKEQKNLIFHIFWDGSYKSYFSEFDKNRVILHGNIPQKDLYKELSGADLLFMPSRFLETFGLVALEAISLWAPVIGMRKWWLSDFVLSEYSVTENNYQETFFEIIEDVEKNGKKLPNIETFSYENWQKNLINVTKNFSRILLVHDYKAKIGWAEMYVHHLKAELEKIGKTVGLFSYEWTLDKNIRRKLFFSSVFSGENEKKLDEKIQEFSPDCIWSHTVLRYIGVSGVRAIKKSGLPHMIMHHDLGLFVPEPSKITDESQIPLGMSLGKWIGKAENFKAQIIATLKYAISSRIFKNFPENTLHMFPSDWMKIVAKNYNIQNYTIFPHTKWENVNENSSKN